MSVGSSNLLMRVERRWAVVCSYRTVVTRSRPRIQPMSGQDVKLMS